MQCSQCQRTNREGAKFCDECGAPLPIRCPACQQEHRSSAKFCSECGIALTGQKPAPSSSPTMGAPPPQEDPPSPALPAATALPPALSILAGERRQVTILFADISGFTALSETRDPEEVRQMMNACFARLVPMVEYYGGTIDKFIGDEIMALFGAPVAYGNDAERAVRTALALMEALTACNVEHGTDLGLHCGINTGLVIAGGIGTSARSDYSVMGDAVNLAARLEDASERGQIFVGPETYRLTRTLFTFEPLKPMTVKGKAEPVQVYRALGVREAQDSGEDGTPYERTPLVGREAEVTLLLDRWTQVKEGRGHMVVLSGDAGIGKTRLMQVLKDQIATEPHLLWECRCSPYHQNTALYPLTELFQRVLHWQLDEPAEEKFQKLETILRQSRLPLAESVPLFAALLSLPVPADRYPPLSMSPLGQRQKTLAAIVTVLVELAAVQPVVLILEDLHWIDPTTIEFLTLLLDQIPTVALFILLTCRPTFQPPWGSRSYLTQMTLNQLSEPQIERMVTGVARGKRLPAAVLQQIVQKTDGVPLFVEEMTKAILESRFFQDVTDHYDLLGPLPSFAIPTSLHDSLMARLDRLISAKGIAQLGAVIGRTFSYALLQAIAPPDEEALQHGLRQLVAAELLYQRGVPPQATYLFKHALIQEEAYQSLLQSTRQQCHQQIAQVLLAQFPEMSETQPELLAHHSFQGEVWDKAVAYFQQAGNKAMARSAYREAVVCFEQALVGLSHLPASRAIFEQGIDLRCDLRNALLPLGDHTRIYDYLCEAETLAHRLDDRQRLGQVAVSMTESFRVVGDLAHAVESGQRALALAATLGDVGLQVRAHYYMGAVSYDQGDYHRAIDYARWNVVSLEGDLIRERFGMTGLPSVLSRTYLGWSLAELGAFAEGLARGEEGIRIAEATEQPFSLIWACAGTGIVYCHKGDFQQGILGLERGLELCHIWDISTLAPMMARALGSAYAQSGQVTRAMPLLEQAVSLGRSGGQALWFAHLSEAYLLADRTEEALEGAQRALHLARDYAQRGYQAYALRLLGEIAVRHEAPAVEPAEGHYRQALALAIELAMRPLQAHCHRGLATLYTKLGKGEQARTEFATARELYGAMDMTFWLPQVTPAQAMESGVTE